MGADPGAPQAFAARAAAPSVALFLQGPRVRSRPLDWACEQARSRGQRCMPVVLGWRLWWGVGELHPLAASEPAAAWHAVPEVVHDAVTERIWGWGLEPAIFPQAGRTVVGVIDGWATRPGLLVAARQGLYCGIGPRLARELQRRNVPIAVIP